MKIEPGQRLSKITQRNSGTVTEGENSIKQSFHSRLLDTRSDFNKLRASLVIYYLMAKTCLRNNCQSGQLIPVLKGAPSFEARRSWYKSMLCIIPIKNMNKQSCFVRINQAFSTYRTNSGAEWLSHTAWDTCRLCTSGNLSPFCVDCLEKADILLDPETK